jgi:hypothetical protein
MGLAGVVLPVCPSNAGTGTKGDVAKEWGVDGSRVVLRRDGSRHTSALCVLRLVSKEFEAWRAKREADIHRAASTAETR